jgi:glycosyltransferase involved in cell wall biosynthesis
MIPNSSQNVAIVAIGRNEGDRLKSCLRAAMKASTLVTYFDSGSVDGSAEYARNLSAQRARNEGFAFAMEHEPNVAFVQFVDGDCELADGWPERGIAALNARQDAGVVCGHVREIHPEATVYNKLCDLAWQKTPGELGACGGIFMVCAEVVRAVGGFRDDVIAGEDDEFCVRVRRAGWKILLLDAAMAGHDAAMTHFNEWCRRAIRTGHAYAQVAAIHGRNEQRYFVRDCRRIWIWGLLLPFVSLCLAPFTYGLSLLLMFGLYALQFGRIYRGGRRRSWSTGDAVTYAFFTVLAKFPALVGMLSYHWRMVRGQSLTIMEHKRSS